MKKPVLISPSILAADFANLGREMTKLNTAGADWIHVDVMDGHFVPNISFGSCVLRAIRPYTQKTVDVHLMINPVHPYIKEFVQAGADILSIHAETPHIHSALQMVRDCGKKVAVALNPGTAAQHIVPVLSMIDMVLVMTVNPGFCGQQFLHDQLEKISTVRKILDQSPYTIDLQVDGGINAKTAPLAIEAGANILVAGSAVFKGGDTCYAENITVLRG